MTDLFKLCEKAIKVKLLREVMAKKVFSCSAMREDEEGNRRHSTSVYTWVNMTRLLGVDGFKGVKPGWTPVASHCLAIHYEKDEHNFLVMTLNSKSKQPLWTEI